MSERAGREPGAAVQAVPDRHQHRCEQRYDGRRKPGGAQVRHTRKRTEGPGTQGRADVDAA